jgi:hypothetical protein
MLRTQNLWDYAHFPGNQSRPSHRESDLLTELQFEDGLGELWVMAGSATARHRLLQEN